MKQSEEDIYEVILWLLDQYDHEFEGRTQLMARAFIDIGIKNPGKPIHFYGRRPFLPSTKIIGNLIHQMLKRDNRVENFMWYSTHFIITKRKDTLCA